MARRLRPEEIVTIEVLSKQGVPKRAIARTLGITEGAVRYQLRRPLDGRRDRRRSKPFQEKRLLPLMDEWMAAQDNHERPANIRHLHEHLVEVHDYLRGEAAYRRLLRLARAHFPKPRIRTYRRVETPPGAQTQTDWGEFPQVDLGDGPERLYAFVMVLSHSRRPAIVWSRLVDSVSWLTCHNSAFTRLGGVAAVNRVDNTKTAISHGAGSWRTIQPTYRAYARTLGFHVDACQPRQPQAKGKTEAKVKLCRGLLHDLTVSPYVSLEELQVLTDSRVDAWCRRTTCPVTGTTVQEAWEAEQELLTPLPDPLPAPFDVAVLRPVHRDCMVYFEGRQYPVPFRYVGRHVEVRGCAETVQIFFADRLLREYPRRTPEKILVDPSCYEGRATSRVFPPPPLGRMGRKLQQIAEEKVQKRSIELYADLMEVSR